MKFNNNVKNIVFEIVENAKAKINSIPGTHEIKTDKNMKTANGHIYYYRTTSRINKGTEILNNIKEEIQQAQEPEETLKSYFFIKIGNLKLDDLVFNVAPAHLCSAFLNHECANCNICYAFKDERQNQPLAARLKNYVFLEYVILTGRYELLKEAVNNINIKKLITAYNNSLKKEDKPKNKIIDPSQIKGIRFNEAGEMENRHSEFINLLTVLLSDKLNLKNSYSYTHNRELNLNLFNINFNLSFNAEETIKYLIHHELNNNIYCNCKDEEEAKDLIKILDSHNVKYVFCNCLNGGNCKSCNYCKKNIKRVIITYNH